MNEISERNPRFLIWVSELYNNFRRFAWSRTIPAVGKAQKQQPASSALGWGGIPRVPLWEDQNNTNLCAVAGNDRYLCTCLVHDSDG